MFGIIAQVLMAVALVAVVVFVFVRWVLRKDTERENRRRHAAKLSGALRGYGLVWIPDLLDCYVIGDYSGIAKQISDVVKLFAADPTVVLREFDEVYERVLAKKLTTPAGRAYVEAKLRDSEAPVAKTA